MNEHQGHRQRMKAKFDKFGAEAFEDHELLEILLYFAIPRADTNLLAHRLINRFGSFVDVINADESELLTVEGVGPKSAQLIKAVAVTAGRYIQRDNEINNAFRNLDSIGNHLIGHFVGESSEKLYLLVFDPKGRLIEERQIANGSKGGLEFSAAYIADTAIRLNSAHVVLAHNHPSGYAYPSKNDIDMTYKIKYTLSQLGIQLIEHFVIAGNNYYPIIKNNNLSK